MCLIIAGPSAHIRNTLLNTKGMLADIFKSNEDGLGVMYKNKRGLRVVKTLPKTLDDVTRLIDSLPDDDRELAMHWRMRTHGDIDLANCHPYDVLPGQLAMMHNGVLSSGNAADQSKSDTWHFINDYLAGPVSLSLDLVHDPAFLCMLGDFIGNNKFVFMDELGRMSIVNRDAGVDVGQLWFSNTYAWSPEMLIPDYKRPASRYIGGAWKGAYGGMWGSDDDSDWEDYKNLRDSTPAANASVHSLFGDAAKNKAFFESVLSGDVDDAAVVIKAWPYSALAEMIKYYKPELGAWYRRDPRVSALEKSIADAVVSGDQTKYGKLAADHPQIMTEVVCYYIEWTLRSSLPAPSSSLVLVENGKIIEPAPPAPPAPTVEHVVEVDAAGEVTQIERVEYENHTILVAEDDVAGFWTYTIVGPDGAVDDEGYGFSDADDAFDWAKASIDADLAIPETQR